MSDEEIEYDDLDDDESELTCPVCHGTGMDWDSPCENCDGEGYLYD